MLLSDYVKKYAEDTPNKVAINYYGEEISYKELDELSGKLANALFDMGYKKGDFGAAFVQSCPMTYIVYLAAMKLGIIIVPIDPMSKELELEYFLNDSGAKLIVTMDTLYPLVTALKAKCNIKDIITISFHDFLPETPILPIHKMMKGEKIISEGAIDCLQLLKAYGNDPPQVDVALLDHGYILYTGGTTGVPKGCVHSYRDVILGGLGQGQFNFHGATNADVMLSTWPLTHVSGIVFGMAVPLLFGMTVIQLARWDTKAAMEAIDKYRVSISLLTTFSVHEVINHPDLKKYDLTSFRVSLIVAFVMPITQEIVGQWEDITKCKVYDFGYGSSEHLNYFAYGWGLSFPRPSCIGRFRLVPGAQARIEDFETGKILPDGQEGEIVTKTPAQLKEYWNKPEDNKKDIVDGWLHTHDIGYIKDGIIYFLGKKSEVVKVSGYTVSLKEIEMFALKHPAIEKVAVIAIPDARKENRMKAFVILKPECLVSAAEIAEWFKNKVAIYKCPDVEIRSELPVSGKGEILKRILLKEELAKKVIEN
jgi:acyl-coenzyme A synthetase/AMP-(fatty) acid ligase